MGFVLIRLSANSKYSSICVEINTLAPIIATKTGCKTFAIPQNPLFALPPQKKTHLNKNETLPWSIGMVIHKVSIRAKSFCPGFVSTVWQLNSWENGVHRMRRRRVAWKTKPFRRRGFGGLVLLLKIYDLLVGINETLKFCRLPDPLHFNSDSNIMTKKEERKKLFSTQLQ